MFTMDIGKLGAMMPHHEKCQPSLNIRGFESMAADERVQVDPVPMVYVLAANAAGVEMVGFCWVSNDNWFSTRSDLWLLVVDKFQSDPAVNLSLNKQAVLLSGEVSKS